MWRKIQRMLSLFRECDHIRTQWKMRVKGDVYMSNVQSLKQYMYVCLCVHAAPLCTYTLGLVMFVCTGA